MGTWLDEYLNLRRQITPKCDTAMYNIQCIKNTQPYLSMEACQTLVQGMVLVHLDYANVIYCGSPESGIRKIQCVQNVAAKFILDRSKHDSTINCPGELHWLPVKTRIEFIILTLVYKCMHG